MSIRPQTRAKLSHTYAHAYGLLVLLTAVLVVLFLWETGSSADPPREGATTPRPGAALPRHNAAIAASDSGPYFSLTDLLAYIPPQSTPPAWPIRPPTWKEYPVPLASVHIASREYTSGTIEYLADHEIRSGDRNSPYVALTFDCEAGTLTVRSILETLRRERTRATFFILGRYAYRNPEIIREIVKGGHELGNHSFFHPRFEELDPNEAIQEITYTEAAVDWALGRHFPMRYIRFPYGGRNNATRLLAAAFGYQSAFWDIDPRGWDPERTAADVTDHVRNRTRPGGIIIMHCSSWDDADALGDVIHVIREHRLVPGTLSNVLTEADRNVPGYPVARSHQQP